MKKLYEEPLVHISMFDDEDDILTASNTTAAEQAEEEIENHTNGGVSVFSVDAKISE